MAFENTVVRRTFGHKRNEVTGWWRKLHNKELNNFYSLPSTSIIRVIKSRRMRWAEHAAQIEKKKKKKKKKNAYKLLMVKPEGKRPLGRPKRRLVDNIKMDPEEIELGVLDWIGLAQGKQNWRVLVTSVMTFGYHKILESSRVAAQLAVSRVVLISKELAS
jgi:hypothetical protein